MKIKEKFKEMKKSHKALLILGIFIVMIGVSFLLYLVADYQNDDIQYLDTEYCTIYHCSGDKCGFECIIPENIEMGRHPIKDVDGNIHGFLKTWNTSQDYVENDKLWFLTHDYERDDVGYYQTLVVYQSAKIFYEEVYNESTDSYIDISNRGSIVWETE